MSPPLFSSNRRSLPRVGASAALPLPASLLRACLLLVALLATANPSRAQFPGLPSAGGGKKKPPPVNMVVQVGHANITRPGEAVPVRVTLDNNDRSFVGRLEVHDFAGHS